MKTNNKLILVGIRADDGEIDHVKCFKNRSWAMKYAQSAGEFAVFATIAAEFSPVPPEK